LGVRYVLEGSVRKTDNRVRIAAQLVDATTGHHVWAERYDRAFTDIFALQDEITQHLVSTLGTEVWEAELVRVQRIPTENLTAYDYVLRGYEHSLHFTKEANAQARQMFEKAIALDPIYAEAYAALADTYVTEWGLQWSQDPQALERAFALGQQAIALQDSLPGPHRLLGWVYLWKKQPQQALAEGERALTLNPNDPLSYNTLSQIMNMVGLYEEAIELAEQAMRLDPRNQELYVFSLGWAYTATRRPEEAIAAFKRTLARYPNFLPAHLFLAILYSKLDREGEARAEATEILRINPNFSLEGLRQTSPDQVGLEGVLDALRKAGLK